MTIAHGGATTRAPENPAETTSTTNPTPAGWYAVGGVQRYWDGTGWTGFTAPLGRPRVKRPYVAAGIELIVMGSLTLMAGLMLTILQVSGQLEEILADAGYQLTELSIPFLVLDVVLGALAVVTGIEVLRLRPAWRVVGIVVASVLAALQVLNLVTLANVLSLLLVAVYVHAIVGLARSRTAFSTKVRLEA